MGFFPTQQVTQVKLAFHGGPKDGVIEEGSLHGTDIPVTFNFQVNTEDGSVIYVYHATHVSVPKTGMVTIHYRYYD